MSRNECAKKVTKKAGEERWGLGKGLLGLDVYGAQEASNEVMEGITRRGEKMKMDWKNIPPRIQKSSIKTPLVS